MKMIHLWIIACFALFLTTGIVSANELDDLEVTVRVIGTDDDASEVEHELHLPDSASDSAREHAEDGGHESEGEHHANSDGLEDHESENEKENIEDEKESNEDNKEGTEDQGDEGSPDGSSVPGA